MTDEDIAAIEEMVGTRPWLVDGRQPTGPASTSQTITAYFAPTTSMPTLRRGAYLIFSRDLNPSPGPWKGIGSARAYVQVAIPGRPFEEIRNDQDPNRPFFVSGTFQNEELVELATFIRSNPAVPEGQGPRGSKVGILPIASMVRRPDGSVTVVWTLDRLNQGQTAIVEKRGADWILISLNRFIVKNQGTDYSGSLIRPAG